MFPLIALLVLSATFYFTVQFIAARNRRQGAKIPPGPKGWPFIGSAHELLSCNQSGMVNKMGEWGEKYGPITQVNLMGTKNVILTDPKIAIDLFVKRGNRYSNRGAVHAVEYITMNQNVGFRPKDDGWRRQRTLMQSAVNTTSISKYQLIMDNEATRSLFAIVKNPTGFHDELLRYSYSVLTSSMFGFSIPVSSDAYIEDNEKFTSRIMTAFVPDKFPSNVVPILRYMPQWLVPSLRRMEALRKEYIGLLWDARYRMEESVKKGRVKDSVYKDFITNRSEYAVTDEESVHTFQGMIDGGTRSPHNNMLAFLMLMMEYPEWQTKLQEEVDKVVGSNRMPDYTDVPNLPTVRAIVKEGVRFRSITVDLGLTHALDQDDIYNGHFFEKGTVFHATFKSILNDPATYPDGKVFNPARWLEPSYPTYQEPLTVYPNCQNFPAFGLGRRACAGIAFAEQSLNILVAKLAWAVTVKRPMGQDGKEIREKIEYEEVQNPRPLRFGCRIVPRDPARVAIIKDVATALPK